MHFASGNGMVHCWLTLSLCVLNYHINCIRSELGSGWKSDWVTDWMNDWLTIWLNIILCFVRLFYLSPASSSSRSSAAIACGPGEDRPEPTSESTLYPLRTAYSDLTDCELIGCFPNAAAPSGALNHPSQSVTIILNARECVLFYQSHSMQLHFYLHCTSENNGENSSNCGWRERELNFTQMPFMKYEEYNPPTPFFIMRRRNHKSVSYIILLLSSYQSVIVVIKCANVKYYWIKWNWKRELVNK